MILAAGRGSRLLPLTQDRPKPMIPFMNEIVLDRIVRSFINAGADNFVFLVDYRKEKVIQHLKKWNIKMEVRANNLPYGTGGAVKRISELLEDWFFVSSSDLITDINLRKLLDFHFEKGSKITVAFSESEEVSHYGIATMDENSKLTRFVEKPCESEAFSNIVNAGIYVVEKEVLAHVPPDVEFDFSKHLFPLLVQKKYPIYGYKFREYWNDIGRHSSYLFATRDAVNGKVSFANNFNIERYEKGVLYYPDTADFDELIVEGFAVLGNNVKLGRGCRISNTVIWDNVCVGENTTISESIIAENVRIGKHCKIMAGAVIGANCNIGENATIGQNLKLWVNAHVGPGAFYVGE